MKYVIFKNGRPAGSKKYASYEAARQQVRKWIRKEVTKTIIPWRSVTTNPAFFDSQANYFIQKHG